MLNQEKLNFEDSVSRFQSDMQAAFTNLQEKISGASADAQSLETQRLNASQALNTVKKELIQQLASSINYETADFELIFKPRRQSQDTFRQEILSLADHYDQVADSISMRVQSVLANVTDKRSRCENKISKLKAAQEQAKDQELDQTVLDSETSRVKEYERQIDDLQKQYDRNQQINQKLLGEIRDQLRDALKMQRGSNAQQEEGRQVEAKPINDDQQDYYPYYDEEEDIDYQDEAMQTQENTGASAEKEGAEVAPPIVHHRLTPKINPNEETQKVNDKALEFDWPTDKDLAELIQTHKDEGKDLRDI